MLATSCHGDGFDMFASTRKRILCKRIGLIASFGQHDFLKSKVYKIGFHVYQSGFHCLRRWFSVSPLLFTKACLLLTTTIVLKTAVAKPKSDATHSEAAQLNARACMKGFVGREARARPHKFGCALKIGAAAARV
jgi:hypothetical protein